jgi:hypothetical protein
MRMVRRSNPPPARPLVDAENRVKVRSHSFRVANNFLERTFWIDALGESFWFPL